MVFINCNRKSFSAICLSIMWDENEGRSMGSMIGLRTIVMMLVA